MPASKKRILFLLSDTGAGHRAAASAIQEAIHCLAPGSYETISEDPFRTRAGWPYCKIPTIYAWLTHHSPRLWKSIWNHSFHQKAEHIIFPLALLIQKKVSRYLEQIRPDLLVSVHPLLNHLGVRWRNQANLNIPFVTVITDLVTVHPFWICPQVHRCLVATPAAHQEALKHGMPPDKIEVCGYPVRLAFSGGRPGRQQIRQQLGLRPQRWTVLITGGGEGIGHIYRIVQAIAQANPPAQLIVVAGRNTALRQKLETTPWPIPVKIFGFVDNMADLMRAADILVTKAGPGALSEAFVSGLPPVISGYIPGQERGNVSYVQNHRAGIYAETPREVANVTVSWMTSQHPIRQQMTKNAARLACPEAALTIASKIIELMPDTAPSSRLPQVKIW